MTDTNANQISGTVKGITFRNEENGYFIARIDAGGREIVVQGTAPVIHEGERLEAAGGWVKTSWGPQFKASEVTVQSPTSLEGIEKYLSSKAIDGIGKAMAKRLVTAFGDKVFDVIETEPARLNTVEGIGPKRAQAICAAYEEQKAVRHIMVFLHQVGMSPNRAKRVHSVYGDKAVEKISENPYVLCQDVWGIGFSTADAVAQKMKIAPDSEYRIRAAIRHVINEASGKGSCGLPVKLALSRASELLGLPDFALDGALQKELEAKTLIQDTSGDLECLFPPNIYFAEKGIATKLYRMAQIKPRKPIKDIDDNILFAEIDMGINLEDSQRQAVKTALENQVCVITGGPGTGKTTITRTVVEIFEAQGLKVAIAAPTGKAARRAAAVSGHSATTIHKLLEVNGKGRFQRTEDNPLECDVLVLDEASMMDVALTNGVLKALPYSSRLIIVGDVDQLESVGPGKVLADVIDSGVIPLVRLTQVFRQAATSKIVMNAHKVNSGQMPEGGWPEGSDFAFLDPGLKDDKQAAVKKILAFIRDLWKKGYDPIRDVQVLCPMKRGVLGTTALNLALKDMLNDSDIKLERFGYSFSPNDKVMQLRNNYEKNVFNGDIGYIKEVEVAEKVVVVDFDGTMVSYKSGELDELALAYAFTTHKSQGSEFPVVLMPVDTSHFVMLNKKIIYTGITRAKKLMVVMGTKQAMGMALHKKEEEARYSKLKDWLLVEAEKDAANDEPSPVAMAAAAA